MMLEPVLQTVADHVSYLRAVQTIEGDDWVGCAELVSDPVKLVEIVRRTKAGFDTDDDAVAASLFTQAYAFRVAGVALAAHALGLPLPNVAAAATAVRLDKPRPSSVAYLDPEARKLDVAAFADELLGVHMRTFVDAVHREFRVGDRLLWGNVAGSCATAYRAVESSGSDKQTVRARAGEFFGAAQVWFDGLGQFTVVEHADRDGWFWDRTSCCLWFRTKREQLCDNCSLIDAAELHERRVHEIAEVTP
jgi:ferric iron reductase protein FhuF